MNYQARIVGKLIKDLITTAVITLLFLAAFYGARRWVLLWGLYNMIGPVFYYIVGVGLPLGLGLLTSFGNYKIALNMSKEVNEVLKDNLPVLRTTFSKISDYDVESCLLSYEIKVNGEALDQANEYKVLPAKDNYEIEIVAVLKNGQQLVHNEIAALDKVRLYEYHFDHYPNKNEYGFRLSEN